MLRQLKYLLNSYNDEKLDKMLLWINSNSEVSNIIVNKEDIDFVTEDFEIKVKIMFDKE